LAALVAEAVLSKLLAKRVRRRANLLKVALDTNGKDSDVLTVGGGLLDKSCVDHAFIFSQRVAAAVADLQGADQLLHKFV
jgi:hypothetical protein